MEYIRCPKCGGETPSLLSRCRNCGERIIKTQVYQSPKILKPDYTNQVFGDIPLELSSEQLNNKPAFIQ